MIKLSQYYILIILLLWMKNNFFYAGACPKCWSFICLENIRQIIKNDKTITKNWFSAFSKCPLVCLIFMNMSSDCDSWIISRLSLQLLPLIYWRIIHKASLTKISEKDTKYRGSRPEMFYKIDFLKNFERFTGKHLCWSLFFNKVAGWTSAA